MIAVNTPLFKLGQVVATPGAIKSLQEAGQSAWSLVSRHSQGDFGDVSESDKQLNDEALKDGGRILSAYHLSTGKKIWVITEAENDGGHRVATTLLLPEEY